MKTTYSFLRRSFATLMVIMGLATGNNLFAQSNSEISSDVKTEVEKLNHDIEKAVLKKDIATIIDLYSDDATIMIPGGKKIQGRKAIAEYWYSVADSKSLKSEIVELGGNSKMLYQIGRWTITKVENGVEKTTTTDVVIIWKRGNDFTYKIQLNSSNNPVASTGSVAEPFEAAKP